MSNQNKHSRPKCNSSRRMSWFLFFVMVVGGLYFLNEHVSNLLITPPDKNATLAECAGKLFPPWHLAILVDGGVTRIVWIGTIPRFTIRSGPPCYIFNERCELIDWTSETGEGWPYDALCEQAYAAPRQTIADALLKCPDRSTK